LAAQLDAEGKVRYGVAQMPTNVGKPVTLGVEDYLMAFKKKDNREAVKGFLDLYYQPEQITRWIAAEGFLPVTASGLAKMGDNPKLKPYLDALPNARLAPTTDPTWDRVKLDVQQSIGLAVQPGGDPKQVLERSLTAASNAAAARSRSRWAGTWRALPWLAPSLSLILAVVLYPAVELIRASFNRYSITGLFQRSVGFDNYARLIEQDALPRVAANTAVWVVLVVGLTLLISLGLAQLQRSLS